MDQSDSFDHPVILFDGMCNLCSGVVQFVVKSDKKDYFKFASLQSDYGKLLLTQNGLPISEFNSFLLYYNNKLYYKSTAALMVARLMGRGMQLLYFFIIIPRVIRDYIYTIISQNRYKWFGKKTVCWIPENSKLIK